MANPSNTTITIDGVKLNAFAANVGLAAVADPSGMPATGSLTWSVDFSADMHDSVNVPFATVKKYFDLALHAMKKLPQSAPACGTHLEWCGLRSYDGT